MVDAADLAAEGINCANHDEVKVVTVHDEVEGMVAAQDKKEWVVASNDKVEAVVAVHDEVDLPITP